MNIQTIKIWQHLRHLFWESSLGCLFPCSGSVGGNKKPRPAATFPGGVSKPMGDTMVFDAQR